MTAKSIKVLVLGDSGCGKSAFVHLFAHRSVSKKSGWTVGCNSEVSIHQAGGKDYFIEFWDVGGNEKFAQARSVFYRDAQGLILVHDLSNKKSHSNLKNELNISTVSASSNVSLPVLVVGTKLDLVQDYRNFGMSEENGLDTLSISCIDAETFTEGSHAQQKMHAFFNRCIQASIAKDSVGQTEAEKIRRLERRLSNSPSVKVGMGGVSIPRTSAASARLDEDIDDDLGSETPRRRTLLSSFQATATKFN